MNMKFRLLVRHGILFRYEVKVLDELETKVEPAVHELRLGWSTDSTDMQLGTKQNSTNN